MEDLYEVLHELEPGQWIVVQPSSDQPTPAVYLWARDERGYVVALARPKGWDAQTMMLHPSRIVETDYDPNPVTPESAWKD